MQVWDKIVANGWQHKERIEWFGQYSSGDTVENIYNKALSEYLKSLFSINHAHTINSCPKRK